MAERTVLDLYRHDVEAPRDAHYTHWKPSGSKVLSTYDFFARTCALADALVDLGVGAGDRVMLLCDDRPEWHISDLAVLDAGAVDVPVYLTLTPDQVAYQVADSGARVAIAENAEQTAKLLATRERCPELEHLIQIEGEREHGVLGFDELVTNRHGDFEGRFWDRASGIDERELMTIIYTSGTTGEPKGVMLSHDNLVKNVLSTGRRLPAGPDDLALEFLPLCHVAERNAGYGYMWRSTSKAYCSVTDVGELIGKIRPSVFFAVPRVYEKVQQKVLEKVAHSSPIRRTIFQWALGVGKAAALQRIDGSDPTGLAAWRHRLADRVVLSKVRAGFGGRLRFCITGAAETPRHVAEFFHALGIWMAEAYGLTETSPVVTISGIDPETLRLGTVGRPLDDVEIRLADDGELLVRGPNVMSGYWNNPEATAAAFDDDGFFRTGDIATVDDDGFVSIIDRKKELIVTSGGKNIAPQPIESRLKHSPFIDIAVLVGDGRPFIAALLSPAFDDLRRWAADHGFDTSDRSALVADHRVRGLYREIVDEVNTSLARYEQIKEFRVLATTLSIEGGHLTPTLKLKRRVISAEFADLIREIYPTVTPHA